MPQPLTIGIDARAATEVPAGRGRYVRELLRALRERNDGDVRYVLYAREDWDEPLDERFAWRHVGMPDPRWHVGVARAVNRECDVYLSTNSYLTAWFLRVPAVVVVYDLVAFDPALHPQRRASLIERATIRPAIRRAARLLAISDATRADLVARFPRAAGKTLVTPLAADPSFSPSVRDDQQVLDRHGIAGPYVLATGTLEPRKNLPRLIAAFTGLDAETRGGRRLVLVGPRGWDTGDTEGAIAAHRELVLPVGRVPDADLPALYRQADAFCYPSIYEGFGLPVLEAMQCGTAVITSSVSSMPEVGGDAVAYVRPENVGAIREGLASVLGDSALRARLESAGPQRAAGFSWERTAQLTLDALRAASPR